MEMTIDLFYFRNDPGEQETLSPPVIQPTSLPVFRNRFSPGTLQQVLHSTLKLIPND